MEPVIAYKLVWSNGKTMESTIACYSMNQQYKIGVIAERDTPMFFYDSIGSMVRDMGMGLVAYLTHAVLRCEVRDIYPNPGAVPLPVQQEFIEKAAVYWQEVYPLLVNPPAEQMALPESFSHIEMMDIPDYVVLARWCRPIEVVEIKHVQTPSILAKTDRGAK